MDCLEAAIRGDAERYVVSEIEYKRYLASDSLTFNDQAYASELKAMVATTPVVPPPTVRTAHSCRCTAVRGIDSDGTLRLPNGELARQVPVIEGPTGGPFTGPIFRF